MYYIFLIHYASGVRNRILLNVIAIIRTFLFLYIFVVLPVSHYLFYIVCLFINLSINLLGHLLPITRLSGCSNHGGFVEFSTIGIIIEVLVILLYSGQNV